MRSMVVICAVLAAWAQAAAYDITILYSSRIEPYRISATAFREALSRKLPPVASKRIEPVRFTEFVVGDPAGRGAAERFLRGEGSDLILAVGGRALSFADGFPRIPLVYTMVPDPASRIVLHREAVGVPMAVPPEQWVEVTRKTLPGVRVIGIVYSGKWSGDFVRGAEALARLKGLDVLALETNSPHGVYGCLEALRGRAGVLWMLPDLTVLTPQTVQAIFRFSMEERVPVVAFAEQYLRKGALIALTPDYRRMGEQAAALAARCLAGEERMPGPPVAEPRVRVKVNTDVAQKLGISLRTAWLDEPEP